MARSGDIAERLFAPCERYEPDPDLEGLTAVTNSCVDCLHQYRPGRVCEEFQRRLAKAAGWKVVR